MAGDTSSKIKKELKEVDKKEGKLKTEREKKQRENFAKLHGEKE